jgi:vitamin B12/bleomycin/antimicrobial peptide transport system ATP-binding/permease protein
MKPEADAEEENTFAHMRTLLHIVGLSPGRGRLTAFVVAIAVIILANAVGQVRLNAWQGAFYDAIGQRDIYAFFRQLGVFAIIISVLLVLGVTQTWLHAMLKVKLREIVTRDLIDQWLMPKRANRMPMAGEIGANPDQRIHEDTRRLTELTIDLGVGLTQSSLMLLSFIGVLWGLSGEVVFMFQGTPFTIPGYMVWCALAYALVGSWITYLVGKPLIRLNARQRSREADLRFALVRVNESSEGVALHAGEQDEKDVLKLRVDAVVANMTKLANGLARLGWATQGYGWIALVAPVLVTAPGYFAGTLSLGGLMMVINAFLQVQQSLRWYVDNFPSIAEWRATLLRVAACRETLTELERLGEDQGFITITPDPDGLLALNDLWVYAPSGRLAIDSPNVEIQLGDRVLILGESRSGKSAYFRALAGLWPWGKGEIRMPPREEMMFMPHRPYIPPGKLRAAITYPAPPAKFSDDAIRSALERLGMERVAKYLDTSSRWDKDLAMDDQQRLAFARVLLHRPRWVFMDEAMNALDEDERRLALSVFEEELTGSAVVCLISVGHNHSGNFFQRIFYLRTELPGLDLPFQRPHMANDG